ncbi:MAG: hypothetical protein ACPHTD_08175 [Gammaproteobacteria bacterium]
MDIRPPPPLTPLKPPRRIEPDRDRVEEKRESEDDQDEARRRRPRDGESLVDVYA